MTWPPATAGLDLDIVVPDRRADPRAKRRSGLGEPGVHAVVVMTGSVGMADKPSSDLEKKTRTTLTRILGIKCTDDTESKDNRANRPRPFF